MQAHNRADTSSEVASTHAKAQCCAVVYIFVCRITRQVSAERGSVLIALSKAPLFLFLTPYFSISSDYQLMLRADEAYLEAV